MLIEVPYKDGDTITFKTVAGEEVIARLVQKAEDSMKISKPMALTMNKDGLGLVPFMFTVSKDSDVIINLTTVVFIAKTEKVWQINTLNQQHQSN